MANDVKLLRGNVTVLAAFPEAFANPRTPTITELNDQFVYSTNEDAMVFNISCAIVDDAFQIPDAEAIPIAFDLLEHEGLCMGGSTGVNVAGAMRMARQLGPGHTIVTILCDYGTRYASKLFNPAFLREKGLPVPAWLEKVPDVPDVREEVPA